MPLTNTHAMLAKATREGYAVGHFNITNLEETQAVLQTCIELDSPVILGASTKALEYAGITNVCNIVQNLSKGCKIPIALHLDHGPTVAWAKTCIQHGWTSIMIDTSKMVYADNVRATQTVVRMAEPFKISVEAEIGLLKGIEDDLVVNDKDAVFTDPLQAQEFVNKTGCHSLAIAIGTSHGAYKFHGKAHLDLKRLVEIREKVKVPLVLHGASSVYSDIVTKINKLGGKLGHAEGVPDSILRQAIRRGICKINTDTDLRLAFTLGVRQQLKNEPQSYDIRETLEAAKEEVTKMVKRKIKVFGCEGKA